MSDNINEDSGSTALLVQVRGVLEGSSPQAGAPGDIFINIKLHIPMVKMPENPVTANQQQIQAEDLTQAGWGRDVLNNKKQQVTGIF